MRLPRRILRQGRIFETVQSLLPRLGTKRLIATFRGEPFFRFGPTTWVDLHGSQSGSNSQMSSMQGHGGVLQFVVDQQVAEFKSRRLLRDSHQCRKMFRFAINDAVVPVKVAGTISSCTTIS
ncbi:MAG: hypothetical protein ACYC3X_26260 [Pirellulaceae bacterium]